ncbi:rRNA small subunit pseudouridine methyltransferase Nep1 [Nematocida sp. AWRm80]|nr:rRNA small subunit pseudouridine methyltransferase Nep1 [Nematocida sp. AWRm80]
MIYIVLEDVNLDTDNASGRLDILHQCMLILLDSPLNKEGKLTILITTVDKKVIEVNHRVRIPRTYNRFIGLLAQLRERQKIYSDKREILLRIRKEDIYATIDRNIPMIGLSQEGENYFKWKEEWNKEDIVFFIKCISSGEDSFKGITKLLSLSKYPLSAATCCSKICCSLEEALGIF